MARKMTRQATQTTTMIISGFDVIGFVDASLVCGSCLGDLLGFIVCDEMKFGVFVLVVETGRLASVDVLDGDPDGDTVGVREGNVVGAVPG